MSSYSCSASNNNNATSNNKILESVRCHYARYIANDNGQQVKGNADGLQGLGYFDAAFLASCGFNTETSASQQQDSLLLLRAFLEPSCGSGCPLRLLLLLDDEEEKPNANNSLLKPGDTVIDLGCGTGHDLILASGMLRTAAAAARTSGKETSNSRVIGVDLTEEMLAVAEKNIDTYMESAAHKNKSEIHIELIHEAFDCSTDELLLAGLFSPNMADVVLSNGVFNLTRDKKAAFATAFWLLKAGGRLLLSDLCRVNERPGPGAFFSPSVESNNNDGGWSA